MMEVNKVNLSFDKPIRFSIPIKMLSLIAIILSLHFNAATQTNGGSTKSKAESYRSIITDFFNVQASVRYVYQTTLNAQGTAIAWSADGEKGQTIAITTLSNPGKITN